MAHRLILKISKRDFVDAALETIRGDPGALGSVNQGLADITDLEDGGGLDVVPVLAGEGIDNLLLDALLASLGEALKRDLKYSKRVEQKFTHQPDKHDKIIQLRLKIPSFDSVLPNYNPI